MNTTYTTETEFHHPDTTTLMELVTVVSDLTDNDNETIQVVRHMLVSNNFSFTRQPQPLRLD